MVFDVKWVEGYTINLIHQDDHLTNRKQPSILVCNLEVLTSWIDSSSKRGKNLKG